MRNSNLLIFVLAAAFLVPILIHHARAQNIDVQHDGDPFRIQIIRPDVFFVEGNSYTIPIIVTNNSNETRDFVVSVLSYPFEFRSSATYSTPVVYEVEYAVESGASFSEEHTFKATLGGRWSFDVTATGTAVEKPGNVIKTNVTGDINIQTIATKVAMDSAEATIQTAQASIEANRINITLVGATIAGIVSSGVIAVVAIYWQSRDRRIERERNLQERKDGTYLNHSKRIAQAMVDCWVTNRAKASWSYENGIFSVTQIPEPAGRYVTQTWDHFRAGYPNVLKIYTDAIEKSQALLDEMRKVVKTFETTAMEQLGAKKPASLTVHEKYFDSSKMKAGAFLYCVRGKALEAIFKEMSNRLKSEYRTNFKIGTWTHGSRIDENDQAQPVEYYPIDIAGWSITVAYGTDEQRVKDLRDVLNTMLDDAKLKEIVESFAKLDDELYTVHNVDLARFNQEVYTILDAAQDDEPIEGRGSCNLCRNDV